MPQQHMTVLVAGASGRTGLPLVRQLLAAGHRVRAVVRTRASLPPTLLDSPLLSVVEASVLSLTDEEMCTHVRGCDAVVSCLGHVLSFRGVFGAPRKLCTDAARRLVEAIERNGPREGGAPPTKFILMNTVGVSNNDLDEHRRRPRGDRALLWLLRYLMPPHSDNETAAEFLRAEVGRRSETVVQWCVVRPDSLHDTDVSTYTVTESPPAPSITAGLPTTRANVAHFMAQLITSEQLWEEWRFRMPCIADQPPAADTGSSSGATTEAPLTDDT